MPADLAGLRVLVTRATHQARPLAEKINQAGGQALLCPLLEITPPADPDALHRQLARIGDYDILVFVSPNAVDYALRALPQGLPAAARLAVVGKGTARQLETVTGRRPALCPARRFDSEGLLELPALQQVQGLKILILRGQDGREQLAETLRARGARVDYAEVYRRRKPAQIDSQWIKRLQQQEIDIISISSRAALDNLLALAEEAREQVLDTALLALHPRIAEYARDAGFRGPIVLAAEASDTAQVDALRTWAENPKQA